MLERNGKATPHAFHPDGRCCTYHPRLPNFLAGAALEVDAASAVVIEQRLAEPTGVSAWGITPSESWTARHRAVGDDGFGVDPTLQCPFWVGGDHACGIWQQRTGVCRTWFCRHDEGFYGALRWASLKDALTMAEDSLARWCVAAGQPPGANADVAQWMRWYRWCAQRVEAFDGADVADAGTPALTRMRAQLSASAHRTQPPMPDVLVASVQHIESLGDGVRLGGYCSYDDVATTSAVYLFLSRLDGARTWRDALADTGGAVDEHTVRELYRTGAVEPPDRPRPKDARGLPIWAG